MSWQLLVTVFTFGGIGAVVRGAIIYMLALPNVFLFPIAVVFINMLAALIGGFIVTMALPHDINAALSVGLVGGLGTLSSFSSDILSLFFDRRHRPRMVIKIIIYFVVTSVLGVVAAKGGTIMANLVLGAQAPYTQSLQEEQNRQLNQMIEATRLAAEQAQTNMLNELKEQQTKQVPAPAPATIATPTSPNDTTNTDLSAEPAATSSEKHLKDGSAGSVAAGSAGIVATGSANSVAEHSAESAANTILEHHKE